MVKRAGWQFRREVTLGAVLQAATLIGALAAGWSNLQKELALLRQEVTVLSGTAGQLREQLERLAAQGREQEARLRALEIRDIHGRRQGAEPNERIGSKGYLPSFKEHDDAQTQNGSGVGGDDGGVGSGRRL